MEYLLLNSCWQKGKIKRCKMNLQLDCLKAFTILMTELRVGTAERRNKLIWFEKCSHSRLFHLKSKYWVKYQNIAWNTTYFWCYRNPMWWLYRNWWFYRNPTCCWFLQKSYIHVYLMLLHGLHSPFSRHWPTPQEPLETKHYYYYYIVNFPSQCI